MKVGALPYPERLAMAAAYVFTEEIPLEIQIDTLMRLFGVRREDAAELVHAGD